MLDPVKVQGMKVNLLFERLVPKTKQVEFNIAWNEILGRMLDGALEAATIQQLQLPQDSKLLVPQTQLKTEGGLHLG